MRLDTGDLPPGGKSLKRDMCVGQESTYVEWLIYCRYSWLTAKRPERNKPANNVLDVWRVSTAACSVPLALLTYCSSSETVA